MRYYEILKKRRIDLKLSIQDVSAQTRLAPEYIKAIEDNDLDVFSDDLSFVRYFIRSYCEALGVNWSMLQEEVDGSIKHYAHLRNMALTQAQKRMMESMPMDTSDSKSRVRRNTRNSYQNRVASTSRSLSRKPRRKLSIKAVIIAAIILCGGFGLWTGMNQLRSSRQAEAQAAAEQEVRDKEAETARLAQLRRQEQGLDNRTAEEEQKQEPQETVTVSGNTVTITSGFTQPVTVQIDAEFSAPTTVWLTEDGALLNDTSLYENTFSQTVTMNDAGTLLFQPARAENMKLTVNGQKVSATPGETGEVIVTIDVVRSAEPAANQPDEGEQNEPAE